jgi:alkylation response protein AidB-like acyl-CoA dehydrogenase
MEGPVDDASPFRRSLREWLAANLSPEVVAAGLAGVDQGDNLTVLRRWNGQLADAGWAAVSWPAEYGGRDAGVEEQLAHHEEMARVGAPGPLNTIGVANIAPALMAFGTSAQRRRHLHPMLRGDEIWCQGMSEPDAGSDLASLRTAAVRDGDDFVVNGQKTWNSLGRHADWCQLFVRTDPAAPRHRGISCLLVDMRSPGIEVRPLRTMAGELTFSDLYFTDVRVPATSLLGPLHEGWRVAMTTLSHERAGVARLHLSLSRKFDDLRRAIDERALAVWPVERDRLAALYGRIACMRWTTLRELSAVGAGAEPSPTIGSLAKLMWAGAEQELADLAVHVLGPAALSDRWAWALASARQCSIAGGTSEVNRNIVAEKGLGLPR